MQYFIRETKERDYLKNQDIYRRTIFKWILKKYEEGVEWTNMAQDRTSGMLS